MFVRANELLEQPESWHVYDLRLEPSVVELAKGSLGMTLCQVPVIVSATSGEAAIEITLADGSTNRTAGLHIDRGTSAKLFGRSGEIAKVHAFIPKAAIGTD